MTEVIEAVNVYIPAEDVWEYACDNADEPMNVMHLIAENKLTGTAIYITMMEEEDFLPTPTIVVEIDDIEEYRCSFVTQSDCEIETASAYEVYLDMDADCAELMEIEIDNRESELDDAVCDLLTVFAPETTNSSLGEEGLTIQEELKDVICSWLFANHNVSVYRPMYLEFEDGETEYVTNPYPQMG